ncbi:hypothetical protein ACFOKJ_11955 [Vogesella amnigena]|uniref:Uncharacterized protein n=1 Tax=Vogesella amnigena TaxID=1507449 RepID=A0ABV7TW17_9NEIS
MSTSELAQCIPRKSLSGNISWQTALTSTNTYNTSLNILFRKFIGNNKIRKSHILAQIYIETGMLRTISEDGNGNNKPYDAFFGRGYLQLTWLKNYKDYGTYKKIPNITNQNYNDHRINQTSHHLTANGGTSVIWWPKYDPSIISTDQNHAGEASGFY